MTVSLMSLCVTAMLHAHLASVVGLGQSSWISPIKLVTVFHAHPVYCFVLWSHSANWLCLPYMYGTVKARQFDTYRALKSHYWNHSISNSIKSCFIMIVLSNQRGFTVSVPSVHPVCCHRQQVATPAARPGTADWCVSINASLIKYAEPSWAEGHCATKRDQSPAPVRIGLRQSPGALVWTPLSSMERKKFRIETCKNFDCKLLASVSRAN